MQVDALHISLKNLCSCRLPTEDPFEIAISKDAAHATVTHHSASSGATVAAAVAARATSKTHMGTAASGSQEINEQQVRDHIRRIKREAEEIAQAEVLAAVVPESDGWSGGSGFLSFMLCLSLTMSVSRTQDLELAWKPFS